MLTFRLLAATIFLLTAGAMPQSADVDDFPSFDTSPLTNKVFVSYILTGNWFRAQRFCAKNGMRLASVASLQENNQLLFLMENLDVSKIWIGATDLAEEGRFYWESNGTALSFTNWEAGQPDNYQGKENCVTLTDSSGTWNDEDCYLEYHFACEIYNNNYKGYADDYFI